MEPARPYYSEGGASTAFYDQITAADAALAGDIDVYADLIPVGGSVLELGSGTGRISQMLATRGFEVVGLELSEPMLQLAQSKRTPDLRLSYVQGDMRAFDVGRRFDAVICPYYALAHMPATPGWSETLSCVARHLQRGAVAAFHMPIAARMAEPAPPAGSPVFQSGPLTVFMAGKVFDPTTGRMDLSVDYQMSGIRSRERLTLYAGELDPIAEWTGLEIARTPIALGSAGFVHVYRR